MELVATIVIIGAIIWYLGSAINSILKGAGEVASTEFDLLKDEQQVRVQKSYDDLGRKLEKLMEESSYDKGTVKAMIKTMNSAPEKGN